jgi:hypothetical protein
MAAQNALEGISIIFDILIKPLAQSGLFEMPKYL